MIYLIWLIGVMFTFGIALSSDDFTELDLLSKIKMCLHIILIWPFVLGFIVGPLIEGD